MKYGGEAIATLLKDYFQQILQLEDILSQWNSSILINIDKGRQDKEKLDNKSGISLTRNIAKLFKKIVINRLKNYLQITEAQAGAQLGKNTLTNLLAVKSVIPQRMTQIQGTYVAFIDLKKPLTRSGVVLLSICSGKKESEENFSD